MDKIKEIVAFLNPGQVPVIAADQPIYAVAKQVQWHWPEIYGEDKFVIMFGGLHIEMAALKSIGTLLLDSGVGLISKYFLGVARVDLLCTFFFLSLDQPNLPVCMYVKKKIKKK